MKNREETQRRIAPRLITTFPVQIFDSEVAHSSHALNVSASGLKLVTDRPLQVNQEFEVQLDLARETSVCLKAEVVWQREVGSMGVNLAGLRFSGQAQESNSIIEEWLKARLPAA